MPLSLVAMIVVSDSRFRAASAASGRSRIGGGKMDQLMAILAAGRRRWSGRWCAEQTWIACRYDQRQERPGAGSWFTVQAIGNAALLRIWSAIFQAIRAIAATG